MILKISQPLSVLTLPNDIIYIPNLGFGGFLLLCRWCLIAPLLILPFINNPPTPCRQQGERVRRGDKRPQGFKIWFRVRSFSAHERRAARGLKTGIWNLFLAGFLVNSESNVRHRQPWADVRHRQPWAQRPQLAGPRLWRAAGGVKREFGASSFLATLGTSTGWPTANSVLQ